MCDFAHSHLDLRPYIVDKLPQNVLFLRFLTTLGRLSHIIPINFAVFRIFSSKVKGRMADVFFRLFLYVAVDLPLVI
jgi:hypothetical protein